MRFMRVMYVSFIAYAFSHTLGFGAVSGGSVRYRFYTRWGVSAYDIATVLIFGGMAYVLGIVAVAGFIVFINADDLARAVDAPIWASHLAGAVAVIVGSSYLIWSIIGKPSFVLKGRRFYPPSLKIGLTQVASACSGMGLRLRRLVFPPAPGSWRILLGLHRDLCDWLHRWHDEPGAGRHRRVRSRPAPAAARNCA